jgi:hypothetical protein
MSWHEVEPVKKPRVHKWIIDQAPLARIRRDIRKLPPKIFSVSNSVLMKSGLPDFPTILCTCLMRKPTLDALRTTLNGLVL